MLNFNIKLLIFPVIAVVFSLLFLIDSFDYSHSARIFPTFLIVTILIMLVPSIVYDIKNMKLDKHNEKDTENNDLTYQSDFNEKEKIKSAPFILSIAVIFYILIISSFGFLLTTFLFLLVLFVYYKVNWKFIIWFLPLTLILLYILFNIIVGVPLPAGYLENILDLLFNV